MIRSAQLTDLPELTQLQLPYSAEMATLAPTQFRALALPDPASFSRYLTGDDATILIHTDDSAQISGYCTVTRARFSAGPTIIPQDFAYVVDLYVTPAARHAGQGKALLQAARDWARKQGLTQIQLNVLANNDAARRLYTHLGFKESVVTMTQTLGQPAQTVPDTDDTRNV